MFGPALRGDAVRRRDGATHGHAAAGRPLRVEGLAPERRLCSRRDPDAVAGHRREHRYLQRRQRRAPQTLAVPRVRAALHALAQGTEWRVHPRRSVARQLRRLAPWEHDLQRHGRVPLDEREPHGAGRADAAGGRPQHGQHLRGAADPPPARAHAGRKGRRARCSPGHRPRLQHVATDVRRRPAGDWTLDSDRRPCNGDRRCDAAGVPLSRPGRGVLDPFRVPCGAAAVANGVLPSGGRPPPSWRFPGCGGRGARVDHGARAARAPASERERLGRRPSLRRGPHTQRAHAPARADGGRDARPADRRG